MSTRLGRLDASLLGIGQEFAGYRVDAGLGRQSGIGRVYEATHMESGRTVALKVFTAPALRDPAQRAHYVEAAEALERLDHPNLARLHAWASEPDAYLVMDLARGTTLADLFAGGRLGDDRGLAILAAVASGLDAAQREELVYRRLQPKGVLVDPDEGDRTLLADFGVGRPSRSTELIETRRLGSLVDYISPEEADDGEATGASTVYSLGAMAFEALAGQPPYPAREAWATLRAHMRAPVPSVRDLRPDLPEELDAVLQRALAKDPAARQSSPGQLMGEVERAYPAEEQAAAASQRSERKRGRLVARAVALVVVMAAAAALGAAVSPAPEDPGPREARRVASDALSLRYPADWIVSREAGRVPGVELSDPVSVAPPNSAGTELVAGRVARGTLPATGGQIVDLGDVLARRYPGRREPGGSRTVSIYALPAADGQVVAACFDAGEKNAFARRCQRAASTLRAREPGPPLRAASPAYARSLGRVVNRLERVRSKGRRRLARARTRAGQRRVTARLSRDYRVLASALTRIETPAPAAGPQRIAISQLRRASRGFRDMSRAARARSSGRWIRARRGVRSAEGRFQGAIQSLRRRGYDVG
jgi:serine/threonine-protein kinase